MPAVPFFTALRLYLPQAGGVRRQVNEDAKKRRQLIWKLTPQNNFSLA